MGTADPCHRLAVIGGGLTGAALIIQALRTATGPLAIDVVEPHGEIGRGAAYGTRDPAHRINVPSGKMSLYPDDPDHFTRWLLAQNILPDAASTDRNGDHYVARDAYGRYAMAMLRLSLDSAGPGVRLRHHQARAIAIRSASLGWTVTLSDGHDIETDAVMLCPGHAPPCPPHGVSEAALRHPGFIASPWITDATAAIGQRDSVLIVGTGLTMADAVASLDRRGHAGPVTAVSRRGLMSLPHGQFLSDIDALDGAAPPATALALLRLMRRRVRQLAPDVGWQPVVDALRFELHHLWPALPPREQRRVVRRLLPFWEVHRFRVAPQIHALLDQEIGSGRLAVEQARFDALDVEDGRLRATLTPRRRPAETRAFDHVVLCTGPAHRLADDPLVAGMFDAGLARPDSVGLGIAVDARSRVLRPDGSPWATLGALGPITRGSFGEMTGAPDIIRHIATVVAPWLATLGRTGKHTGREAAA